MSDPSFFTMSGANFIAMCDASGAYLGHARKVGHRQWYAVFYADRTSQIFPSIAEAKFWLVRKQQEATRAGGGSPEQGALAERLTEALRAMCAEFRGHDLPYGSPAYHAATALLAEIDGGRA